MKAKIFRILGMTLETTTQGSTVATLSDWAQRLDPDGNVADVANVLAQNNEILEDMLWMEANQPTSHVSTITTGLPAGTWRLLNYGVPNEKGTTKQVTDGIGMLESYSTIDASLLNLNGNSAAWRMSEEKPFIEGLSQTFAETLIYGSSSEPEKFVGLAARTDGTPQSTDDQLATYNIIDAGGTGSDNTSIYLVGWGTEGVMGAFPKGSKAGLSARDLGEDTLTDSAGNSYQGFRTHYKWDGGLVVKNWKYLVRIANIDFSDLTTDASAGANLIELMIEASERLPGLNGVKPVFYCNRQIRTFLRNQINNKSNNNLTRETIAGKLVTMFDEIPVRRVDRILNTEALVA